METVNIEREKLLEIVRTNRIKHTEQYLEACEDYKTAIVKVAHKNLDLSTQGNSDYTKWIPFPAPPKSYDVEYNRSLRMLELSVDDVIALDEQEFNRLVLDEWNWKREFTLTSSLYKTL